MRKCAFHSVFFALYGRVLEVCGKAITRGEIDAHLPFFGADALPDRRIRELMDIGIHLLSPLGGIFRVNIASIRKFRSRGCLYFTSIALRFQASHSRSYGLLTVAASSRGRM